MPIPIQCEKCGQQYRVKEELVGSTVTCKTCGHAFKVALPFAPLESDDELEPSAEENGESCDPNIQQHEARERDFELAFGDEATIAQVEQHVERYVGKVETVFHELVSDLVHLDIHWVQPTPERNYHTLITSGMSELPMTVPEGAEEFRFAELLVCLPPDWPISQEAFEDENNYWPVRWLKILGRFPHEYETWLGPGHTVPNGDPPEPFAENTRFCCWMVASSVLFDEEFCTLEVGPEKTINFYALYPLYKQEMDYKLRHGSEALLDALSRVCEGEVIDLGRRNACRKGLWPFG